MIERFPTREALVDLLKEVLKSSDDHTLWHAARFVGEWHLVELVPQLADLLARDAVDLGSTDARRIAARSLGQLGLDAFEDRIREMVRSENPLSREGIADALGEARDKRAVPYLRDLVLDSDLDVSMWAALGFAKIGAASVPVLEELLSGHPEVWRAVYLLDALKKVGTSEAVATIEDYLKSTEHAELRKDRSWLDGRK